MTELRPAGPIVRLENVSKRFSRRRDLAARIVGALAPNSKPETVHAVDNVSLDINQGEIFGLVGESGCGKSTLGRIIAGLHLPSEGSVSYKGQPLASLNLSERTDIQMIFQDPQSSLNPRMRIAEIVAEGMISRGRLGSAERAAEVARCLESVGLNPSYQTRFPHQFSGGQRQRISIARALATDPKVLVCDESIASLDVSIQAQVVNLFMELRRKFALTYVFISHGISVVRHISDRVGVMYLGRIVEVGNTDEVFAAPRHPYTQALLASVPDVGAIGQKFRAIKGELPSPLAPPSGCHFHLRCPFVMDICKNTVPKLAQVGSDHRSACHLNDTVERGQRPEHEAEKSTIGSN